MPDFPTALSALVDNVDDVLAKHINNIEEKLGIDSSTEPSSHDYKIAGLESGWINANEDWTYASATTITVPAGATSKYSKGDKIKLTQTTIKYFYIVGVADTLLTITGGDDYTLVDAAISDNFYSKADNPQGFPHWFNYSPTITWTAGTNPSGSPTKSEKFRISGNTCYVNVFNYNYTAGATVTRATISLPVAILSGYMALCYCAITATNTPNGGCGHITDSMIDIYCTSVSANRIAAMGIYQF